MQSRAAERAKQEAGYYAAGLVEDGMVVGLGTGSTTRYAMERLSARIGEGLRIQGIPTSFQAAMRAQELHIPLTTLDEFPELDIAIDGADQVDPALRLIKGRGAAQTREKVVAASAQELVIVIDQAKLAPQLDAPIPVEVIPFAVRPVMLAVQDIGGSPAIRQGVKKDGPVISDNGNFIIDCAFGPIRDPEKLEAILSVMAGVVSCGLFTEFTEKTIVVVGEETRCRIMKR